MQFVHTTMQKDARPQMCRYVRHTRSLLEPRMRLVSGRCVLIQARCASATNATAVTAAAAAVFTSNPAAESVLVGRRWVGEGRREFLPKVLRKRVERIAGARFGD